MFSLLLGAHHQHTFSNVDCNCRLFVAIRLCRVPNRLPHARYTRNLVQYSAIYRLCWTVFSSLFLPEFFVIHRIGFCCCTSTSPFFLFTFFLSAEHVIDIFDDEERVKTCMAKRRYDVVQQ